jgi:LacI family gluconate utilization system Gnt-I transcriptional repressor
MAKAPPRRRTRSAQGTGRRPAKLVDVARLAGVSPITASRALQKPHLVADETAARVRAAAERLAYVPNGIAGGLSSRKSNMVIAVIPSTFNPVFTDLVESLRLELDRAGYQLFLGLSEYDEAREDKLITTVIRRRPDAIVLTGVVHSPDVRWRLAGANIPVVETWDLTPTPIDMLVGFSNEQAGRAAADYLLARGRRRLAMVIAHDQRSQLRRAGYVAATVDHGLRPVAEIGVRAPTTLGTGREAFARLLDQGIPFDALFCTSDQLAMGAMHEARARGISVPAEVAVIGFGDLAGSAHTSPSLTTVASDGARIGREAARMLLQRLAGDPPPHHPEDRILDVGFQVIGRESA